MCVCVRACVRACVCACVRASARARTAGMPACIIIMSIIIITIIIYITTELGRKRMTTKTIETHILTLTTKITRTTRTHYHWL